jgi:GNAT superfamily N-acetyltransferase
MPCDICGLDYAEDFPPDQAYHRAFHDPIAHGVYGRPLRSDQLVWSDGDLRITVVDVYSPKPQQQRAAKTAGVAHRDARFDGASYGAGEGPDEYDVHVFLLYSRNRIIGMGVFRYHHIGAHMTWHASRHERIPREEGTSRVWTVDMIWVHTRYRGRGYAHRLIEQATIFFGITTEALGWSLPFTSAGERLARSIYPESFIAV